MEDTAKNPESLDIAAVQELRELTEGSGHPEQFRELVTMFLEGLEPGLVTMREALAAGDTGELKVLAHGFKGTSASMGAMNLATLCVGLEAAAGNRDAAKAQLKQIESEVNVVRRLWEREVK